MSFESDREKFLDQIGSVKQLLALFELMPDISFFMKDRKGRFVALNARGREYCGVKSERDAFGKTDRDFFSESRAAEYINDDRTVIDSGKPIVNRIESAPEMAGSPHMVITNKIPIRDAAGHVIGVAGFSRRVEQVKSAPEAMNKLAAAIEHLHRNHATAISTESLARQAGLSVSQFERTFRKAFGTSPRQYLVRVRVEHACRLLSESDKTIADIAIECGFYDHAHFTRAFTSLMGTSPTQYRRDH